MKLAMWTAAGGLPGKGSGGAIAHETARRLKWPEQTEEAEWGGEIREAMAGVS